jgi:hypothetical protein
MANFKEVNKAIRAAYPLLDIEVVRGKGYVYFDGQDAFGKIESIYVNPASTSTANLIKFAMIEIQVFFELYPFGEIYG